MQVCSAANACKVRCVWKCTTPVPPIADAQPSLSCAPARRRRLSRVRPPPANASARALRRRPTQPSHAAYHGAAAVMPTTAATPSSGRWWVGRRRREVGRAGGGRCSAGGALSGLGGGIGIGEVIHAFHSTNTNKLVSARNSRYIGRACFPPNAPPPPEDV